VGALVGGTTGSGRALPPAPPVNPPIRRERPWPDQCARVFSCAATPAGLEAAGALRLVVRLLVFFHDEEAGQPPSFFHWLSVDRWRPLRSAAGCSRTLPGGGVRRRARRGWHVIAKCEDGNSGHHDPDDKCRQEPSAAVSVTERSLSVGVQARIGLLRLSVGRLAIDHSFPLPVVGPMRL
jgi:hypothetical protein